MAERSIMRASDTDREQIADQLRRAADEGRLLAHEFEERLGAVLNARTYGELDAIVSDLPGGRDLAPRPSRAAAALRRRRRALIATTAGALATGTVAVVALFGPLTAASVRTSSPAGRPPLASIPTGSAGPRAVDHVVTYATTTTVAASPPPRGSYSTTATTVASSASP